MTGNDNGHGADLVAAYVDRVEAEWIRYDVEPRVRRRLAGELEQDLSVALASGPPAHEVFATEPEVLAREIAAAEGVPIELPVPRVVDLAGMIRHGLGGAVAMTAFVWFFALRPLADLFYSDTSITVEVISLVIVYGICVALVLAGAAFAMARYLRAEDDSRRTVARCTALMAGLGLVGVACCVAIAPLTDYSSAPLVVLLYVGLAGGLCSAGIALGWRPRRQPRLNRPGLVGVSFVWKRGWTHAEGHHCGEADDASLQP